MKEKLDKLKKQYDGKSVSQCVKIAKNLNTKMIEQGEKLVDLLWYLEKTKRFKEFAGYEKMAFADFISEVCLIPYNRYKQIAWAYNWYSKESREYGPQTIQKIREAVGVTKVPAVLKEIKTKLNTAKPKAVVKKREIVSDIIKSHTPKKVTNQTDTKAYWKKEAHRWERIAKNHVDEIRELTKEINELKSQLAKNRVPLEAFHQVRELVSANA
jgi:hypothetical protein